MAQSEADAVEMVRVLLEDAIETGIIEDYAKCEGTPAFDIWPIPGDDDTAVQIVVWP